MKNSAITKLPIDTAKLSKGVLTDVRPAYQYDANGNRNSTIIGYKYSVAFPNMAFEKVDVMIEGDLQVTVTDFPVNIVLENVNVSIYTMRDSCGIKMTASAIKIVSAPQTIGK